VLQADYKLVIALNGETALKLASATKPDLILLDIMMPGMDGYEACRRLRADPVTRGIPVLFLTALDDVKNKVAGFEAGGSDYVKVADNADPASIASPVEAPTSLGIQEPGLLRAVDDDPAVHEQLARFRPPGEAVRALVFECNPADRDLLLRMIHKEGWQADIAADLAAGVRLYQEHRPGLILLDPVSPEMDGFELIGRIRSLTGGEHPPLALILPAESSPADQMQLNGSLARAVQGAGLDREALLREVHRLALPPSGGRSDPTMED
jgi:DNA-binding response OmpR family regulator